MEKPVLLQAVSFGIMKPTNPTPRRLVRSLPFLSTEVKAMAVFGRVGCLMGEARNVCVFSTDSPTPHDRVG
jgi:hypothetical protein